MHGVHSQQVNIMLLPRQKPFSYSLLKVVYVTSQFHHPLVMYPILRKMLDPLLTRKPDTQVRKKVWPNTNKKVFAIPIFICSWPSSSKWPSNPYTSSGYKGPENQTCNASVNSQFHLRLALPPGWPPGISIFFALDGKFPGVGTLELSNPPGWGQKKCPVPRQQCNIFYWSHSPIVPF